jgi:hypothetical protein
MQHDFYFFYCFNLDGAPSCFVVVTNSIYTFKKSIAFFTRDSSDKTKHFFYRRKRDLEFLSFLIGRKFKKESSNLEDHGFVERT